MVLSINFPVYILLNSLLRIRVDIRLYSIQAFITQVLTSADDNKAMILSLLIRATCRLVDVRSEAIRIMPFFVYIKTRIITRSLLIYTLCQGRTQGGFEGFNPPLHL